MELDQDTIRKFAWHLKVMGAYVQQPTPAIVGLDQNTIISSNDAAALYPTGIIYGNIGFDTIRHRVYDTHIISNFIGLVENVFKSREQDLSAVDSAINGFKGALDVILKQYFKNKSVQNKKEAREFTLEYYPLLLRRILEYKGSLDDILSPTTDKTYYLLKSCLYPLLETITWLNPTNKGYNQLLVDYVFFNDEFKKKPKDIYMFMDINSTKTQFKKYSFEEGIEIFKQYVVNPYGILFDKHDDNLAYDVELLMEALARRRVIKNQMLVLQSLSKQWKNLSEESLEYFYSLPEDKKLTSEQANKILDEIKDTEAREKRIQSLTEVEWKFEVAKLDPLKYSKLRVSQLNIVQLGIKVAANSAYGIFGLITWPFASPLIGNAITNAGKIYGIKLFQAVVVDVLNTKKQGE